MIARARRVGGVLVLLVPLAFVLAPAEAATPPASPGRPALSAAAAGRSKVARRARARRVPASGCFSRNAIVIDPATGEVLYEKNAGRSVPIASLSKLMTAIVFLERDLDLDRVVDVTRDELDGGGHSQLVNRERLSLRDLLHMSLMCSDNVATRVMVRESGHSAEDFLARMNQKALEIGLASTRFVEGTGLDARNVATAADVAKLMQAAAGHPLIQEIMTLRSYAFRSDSNRPHQIGNTNRLLYGRYEVLGGKTGFISQAGYCFATWLRAQGRDLIAVVLGAPTNATRFADVMRIVQRATASSIAQGQS